MNANLLLYFIVVFGIIALPGMDMAFVMSSAMLGGRRAGMAAVAGIVAGGVCHLLMGGLGVAAVLKLWPALFQCMLVAGAAYIAWIGIAFLRSENGFQPGPALTLCAPGTTFRRAMVTSLLNPKAYLFMLAIFPQFLKPAAGPIWAQASVLGSITAGTQLAVYGVLALLASQASGWFARHPGASTAVARAIGLVLLGTACWTASQVGTALL